MANAPEDELGTINYLTPEIIIGAAGLVRRGAAFNLDYPINHFEPFWSGTREPTNHVPFSNATFHNDDRLDNFYLQSTSQIDGLRHFGHPNHGFYGGRSRRELDARLELLGIQRWAQRGIVGRGVLLDIGRQLSSEGRPLDVASSYGITVDDLENTRASAGAELRAGDIVLIRTGWAEQYLALTGADRAEFNTRFASSGLAQRVDVVRWLEEHQIALIAADNVGVERYPFVPADSEYFDPAEPKNARGPDHRGMLHRPLIGVLGLALGELWALDGLAADCAEDGVYEFMVTCKPLNVIGAAGSPANALAIK